MREEIISLETRLAYQENMIEELNRIIYQQQIKLDYLMEHVPVVLQKMQYLEQGEDVVETSEEAPPPHY